MLYEYNSLEIPFLLLFVIYLFLFKLEIIEVMFVLDAHIERERALTHTHTRKEK